MNLKGFIQHLVTLISDRQAFPELCILIFKSSKVSFYSVIQEVKEYSASLEDIVV